MEGEHWPRELPATTLQSSSLHYVLSERTGLPMIIVAFYACIGHEYSLLVYYDQNVYVGMSIVHPTSTHQLIVHNS